MADFDMAAYMERERIENLQQKVTLPANLDRYGLANPLVTIRLPFYKTERCFTWVDAEGARVIKTEAETEAMTIPDDQELNEYKRILETQYVTKGPGLLSDLVIESRDLPYGEEGKALTAAGFSHGFSVEVHFDLDGSYLGRIDSDRMFYFESAPTVREFIGWAWCSSLGRTKELSADLDKASARICRYIVERSGMVFYENWSKEIAATFVRDETTHYEGSSLVNPLLAVATKLLVGKEHPGFNICW